MTPQELKNSILQLAVQGKLTNQFSSDGDAHDLIAKLCIDQRISPAEEPFDIPDNWAWIPIGNLGETTDTDSFCDGPFGSNLKTIHHISKPEVRIIQLSNIGEDGWKDKNVKYTSFKHLEEVIPRCEVKPGDFVIAKMMPAGRTIQIPELGTRITLGSDAMKFVPNQILNRKYLLYAMRSQAFLGQVYAEAHGITRVRTTLNGVKSYVLPIPPIAEQKRIVDKIEELLPYIDRYEKAWSKLEDLNKRFPIDMQKSILQYAIQGKLVERIPEEGTAEELFQQMQAEKNKLIKEGKIKKEKPLTDITDNEIPFDVPDSWKWIRVGNVGSWSAGATPPRTNPAYYGGSIPWLKTGDLNDGFIKEVTEYITDLALEKTSVRLNPIGSVLMAMYGATIGKLGILEIPVTTNQACCACITYTGMNNKYLFYYLMSMRQSYIEMAEGGAQPNISKEKIVNSLLPLPPTEEQHRIVTKIEELLPLCERLK